MGPSGSGMILPLSLPTCGFLFSRDSGPQKGQWVQNGPMGANGSQKVPNSPLQKMRTPEWGGGVDEGGYCYWHECSE